MPQRFEGHLQGRDQTELFFQTWQPEKVRGVCLITHGLAEHSECYHALAKALNEDGWLVYAWDLRGHGRSEGKRGFVRHFTSYVDDLELVVQMVRQAHPDKPLAILGHSLGGLITIRMLQTRKVDYTVAVLSSPALGISVAVPALKVKLAKVAYRFMPTLTMHNEISYDDLTRDPAMVKTFASDALRHDKISPGTFLGMVENFPLALAAANKIDMPVLMQIAGDDRIVSATAAREFFKALPSSKKQLEIYPESLHEVYNDLDRTRVLADLKKFLNSYLEA